MGNTSIHNHVVWAIIININITNVLNGVKLNRFRYVTIYRKGLD